MPINFIPNDPLAIANAPLRQVIPRTDRPGSRAGFRIPGTPPAEALFNVGTPEFLHWQAREAALWAVEVWEGLDERVRRWARNSRRLFLLPNAGRELNAFYDRRSLSFFEFTTGNKTTFSGASTDVVCHEAGHALLDAIRPDLFQSMFTEVSALHEAFGDILAILTALSDQAIRESLLQVAPTLAQQNFVEGTAEDLSDGVRRFLGSNHGAAQPRHAYNNFQWALPESLPPHGPPGVLSREIHSFGRIFSGCIWDCIRNVFRGAPRLDQESLGVAAQTVGRLLIAALRNAPEEDRFFQSVGQEMLRLDNVQNGNVNQDAIGDAFLGHTVTLAIGPAAVPSQMLDGREPRFTGATGAAILARSTRRDLRQHLGLDSHDHLRFEQLSLGKEKVVQVVHRRQVELSGISEALEGVVAPAMESVLVGGTQGQAAVLGTPPLAAHTDSEVRAFVESLVANDAVSLGQAAQKEGSPRPSFAVRKRGERRVLRRLRYSCCF